MSNSDPLGLLRILVARVLKAPGPGGAVDFNDLLMLMAQLDEEEHRRQICLMLDSLVGARVVSKVRKKGLLLGLTIDQL